MADLREVTPGKRLGNQPPIVGVPCALTAHDDAELQIVTVASRQPQCASSHANDRTSMRRSNSLSGMTVRAANDPRMQRPSVALPTTSATAGQTSFCDHLQMFSEPDVGHPHLLTVFRDERI
jgi:hypothetical protein